MAHPKADADLEDRGCVKVRCVADLAQLLSSNRINYETAWKDPADSLQDLYCQLCDGKVALFQGDKPLRIVTEVLFIQVRSGKDAASWVLANTHQRLDHGVAILKGKVPQCQRNMLRTHHEVVQLWLSGVLGLDLRSLARRFSLAWSTVSEGEPEPSESFPTLLAAVRSTVVEVCLAENLLREIHQYIRCGRPIVNARAPLSEGLLWCWLPASMALVRPEYVPYVVPRLPNFSPFNVLEEVLLQDFSAQEAPDEDRSQDVSVGAVLRAQQYGASAVVLLATLPPLGMGTGQRVLLHVDLELPMEELRLQASTCKSLYEVDPRRVARLLNAPKHDDYARAVMWHFSLDHACWHVPEYSEAARRVPLLVVLDSVVQLFSQGDHIDQTTPGEGGQRDTTASSPSRDLAPRLPRLLMEVVGIGGILSRFMVSAKRSEKELVGVYALERLIATSMTAKDRLSHSLFGNRLRELLGKLCLPENGYAGEDNVGVEAASMLERLRGLCEGLLDTRAGRQNQWRPLCCLSHGGLSCSNIVADVLGSVWICGASPAGGIKPVFWDVVALSLNMLLECCRIPVSLLQLCLVAAEPWVSSLDMARWLGISPCAAKALLEKAREVDLSLVRDVEFGDKKQRLVLMKLVEAAAAADKVGSEAMVMHLKAQIVLDPRVASQALQEVEDLVEAWLLYLSVSEPFPTELPEGVGGSMQYTWELQHVLWQGARAAYFHALDDFILRRSERAMAVDSSPLLLELPLLHHLLKILNDPLHAPWHKLWMCRFAISLSERLCRDLSALDTADCPQAPSTPSCRRPPLDAQYAKGHRLVMWSRLTQDPSNGSAEDVHTTQPYGSLYGITIGPDNEDLLGDCGMLNADSGSVNLLPLPSWPCPVKGVSMEQMWHMQSEVGKPYYNDMEIEGRRVAAAILQSARRLAWQGSEACCLYEVVDIVGAGSKDELIAENCGPSFLLSEGLVVEELYIQEQYVGLACAGEPRVRPCHVGGAEHHAIELMDTATAYSTFSCSSCQCEINLPTEGGDHDEIMCVHCEECWYEGHRFDLCMDCAASTAPTCTQGHKMTELEESPYDLPLVCWSCKEDIEQMPPWDEPPKDGGDPLEGNAAEAPHFFHCPTCWKEGLPPSDVCRRCAAPRCPSGHPMSRVDPCYGSDHQCRYCGGDGAGLFFWQCFICQADALQVVYPSGRAAAADIGIAAGRRVSAGGGIAVISVVPGGAASIAGVRGGQRIIAINKSPVTSTTTKPFAGIAGPVTVEFATEQFDVIYESSTQVQQDLVLRWRSGTLIVKKVAASGPALRGGVTRGDRVAAINKTPVEELQWDGINSLDSVLSAVNFYCLRFLRRGPECIAHAKCGIQCNHGHSMTPQYPGFLTCKKGHMMVRNTLQSLDRLGQLLHCADCGKALNTTGSPSTSYFSCTTCTSSIMSLLDQQGTVNDPNYANMSPQEKLLARRNSNKRSSGNLPHEDFRTGRCMLCWKCAQRAADDLRSPHPYARQASVQCLLCHQERFGRSNAASRPDASGDDQGNSTKCAFIDQQSVDVTSFFHCGTCWAERETQYDLCDSCSSLCLRCRPRQHRMDALSASPYVIPLECGICGSSVSIEATAFHCMDCWRGAISSRTVRCKGCALQPVVLFTIDENCRFKVFSGEAASGDTSLSWPAALTPEAIVTVGDGLKVAVRLQLRGFIYPLGARVRVAGEDGQTSEATVCKLLETGKYEICLDGGAEVVPFEPVLGNHVPSGVWRYSPGQKLTVFFRSSGWLDVRVCAMPRWGSRHLVASLGARSASTGKAEKWEVDLNMWNHSPLWLESEAWFLEQRIWDAQVMVQTPSADLLTGVSTDVLQHVWNVREVCGATVSGSDARVSAENKWMCLLQITMSSTQRHKGIHNVSGAWIWGETSSGKTLLLKRLAVECTKAHGGEMVPILFDAVDLLKCWDNLKPDDAVLQCGELLEAYLSSAHADGSLRFLFLKQALQTRRAVILIDGFDVVHAKLRDRFLLSLRRLVALGHRVVVTSRCMTQNPRSNAKPEGVAVPPEFMQLRLIGLDAPQRHWLAERRLGSEHAREVLKCLGKFDDNLFSTAPMFEFMLRYAELVQLDDRGVLGSSCRTSSLARKASKRGTSKLGRGRQTSRQADTRQTHCDGASPRLPRLGGKFAGSPKAAPLVGKGSRVPDPETQTSKALPQHLSEYLKASTLVACRHACNAIRKRTSKADAEELEAPVEEVQVFYRLLCHLAHHVQKKGAEEFGARDAMDVCNATVDFSEAWRVLMPLIERGDFFLIRCKQRYSSRSGLLLAYHFPHPIVQHCLASYEILDTWGSSACPIENVDGLVCQSSYQALVPFFAEQAVESMEVRLRKLSVSEAIAVAGLLTKSAAFTSLSFEGAGIGQGVNAFKKLTEALALNKTLRRLDLTENGLGSEGADKLCGAVVHHPTLRELLLRGNHIGRLGAGHVGEMLKHNRSITKLDLADNSIGDQGLFLLLPGLDVNATLQWLNLQSNHIGPDCQDKLAHTLRTNAAFRVLDTRHNRRGFPDQFSSNGCEGKNATGLPSLSAGELGGIDKEYSRRGYGGSQGRSAKGAHRPSLAFGR